MSNVTFQKVLILLMALLKVFPTETLIIKIDIAKLKKLKSLIIQCIISQCSILRKLV